MEKLLTEFVETFAAMRGRIHGKMEDNPAKAQLTMNQFRYIQAIGKLGSPTISEIASALNITKASVTAGINKLIELGFVTKSQSDSDKRVYYIRLTESSQRMVDAKHQALADFGAALSAALTLEEAQQLTFLLAKILKVFKNEQGDK